MAEPFRCIIHGSFAKHFSDIKQVRGVFEAAGIEVLAPGVGEFAGEKDGFKLFEGEQNKDPRLVELLYLHNLKKLGQSGFSYFINPEGYIGKSGSYELGIAQLTNTRCFFSHRLSDQPAYQPKGSIISPENLVDCLQRNEALPLPAMHRRERRIHELWESLMVPGSVVAAGAIIEHQAKRSGCKEILLVKTHKWGGRYSIVGGKVRRGERLHGALLREVAEETSLKGEVGTHICTFDEIKNSGYYQADTQHIFVDNVVKVKHKKVILNHEAQNYVWALPHEALRQLDIEPNARTTIEQYTSLVAR